jgi:hypothetical protein
MFICVCKKCAENTEDAVVEINFIDKKIYFTCPSCKERNEVTLEPKREAFPRTRRL